MAIQATALAYFQRVVLSWGLEQFPPRLSPFMLLFLSPLVWNSPCPTPNSQGDGQSNPVRFCCAPRPNLPLSPRGVPVAPSTFLLLPPAIWRHLRPFRH